jgi:phage terminase small subunit
MDKAKTPKVAKKKKEAPAKGVSSAFDPSQPLENEGHERFCLEVLNRKPNVKAYQLAFPDSDYMSAASSSTRLIKDDKITSRIAFMKEEQRNRLRMSADDVIMGLEMAAQLDLSDLFNPDGSIIPLRELSPEVRRCIEKIEHDDIWTGEGANRKNIGRTSKVAVISKARALELLAKHHKLLTDRIEVKHTFSLEDLVAGDEQ